MPTLLSVCLHLNHSQITKELGGEQSQHSSIARMAAENKTVATDIVWMSAGIQQTDRSLSCFYTCPSALIYWSLVGCPVLPAKLPGLQFALETQPDIPYVKVPQRQQTPSGCRSLSLDEMPRSQGNAKKRELLLPALIRIFI